MVDQVRGLGIFLIVCALAGALAGRGPFHGLRLPLTIGPFYLVELVPSLASATVGWEGGLILGIAGAAAGAAAGATHGWLFSRWLMPEFEKRRAREMALRPPGSTDGPGSSGSMEHNVKPA